MKTLIIKYKFAIIILFIALSVFVFWLIQRGKTNTDIEPVPTSEVNSWEGLTPGKSSVEDLNKVFGQPLNINGENYEYESKNPNINNQALVNDNTAVLLKRITIVEEYLSLDESFSKYGYDYQTLYGPRSSGGDNLYVYPEKGLALLGNTFDDSVSEIWYFVPVESTNEFISRFAQDYSVFESSGEGQF